MREPATGSVPSGLARRVRLFTFAAIVSACFVAACVDGRTPVGPVVGDGPAFQILPKFSSLGFSTQAGDINRIRITVRPAGVDSILGVFTQNVDPNQASWALSLTVQVAAGASTRLDLAVELVNVDGGGTEVVEWSGRSAATATPGTVNTVRSVDVFRGPLENLGVQSVTISALDSTRFIEGDTLRLTGTITGTGGGQIFWGSLDSTASVDGNGLVRTRLPGTARIVAVAGPRSDTVTVNVIQAVAGVRLDPDTSWVFSLGDTFSVGMDVVDPRGDPVSGAHLWWELSDSSAVQDLGGGRFLSLDNGRASLTVHGARGPPSPASGPRSLSVVPDTAVTAHGMIVVTQAAARIVLTPDSARLLSFGDTMTVGVAALDLLGNPVPRAIVRFTSSDNAIVRVDSLGKVRARGNGLARVIATSGTAADTAAFRVVQRLDSISLQPAIDTIELKNDTLRLRAIMRDANDSAYVRTRPIWSSSDSAVARVDSTGLVRSVAGGVARIDARVDSMTASATIIVRFRAGTVALAPRFDTLNFIGDSTRFQAAVFDAQGDTIRGRTVQWSVADSVVASVDAAGRVVARSVGTTTVRAASDSLSATAPIVVRQVVASVTLSPDTGSVSGGDTLVVTAVLADSGSAVIPARGVRWSSSDVSLATTDSVGPQVARVIAHDTGSVVVTASVDSVQGTARFSLLQGQPAALVLGLDSTTMIAGNTTAIPIGFQDSRGRTTTRPPLLPVTWSSADTLKVTVDTLGNVTARSVGSAYVRAQSGAMVDSVRVDVIAGGLAFVRARPATDTATVLLGDTLVYVAVGFDSVSVALTQGSFRWSVADTSIARVVGSFNTVAMIDTLGFGVTIPGDSMLAFFSTALVVAHSVGTTAVVATDSVLGVTHSDTVATVSAPIPTAIVLGPDSVVLAALGDSIAYSPVVTDAGASVIPAPPLVWTSSNPAVASVDAFGVARAIANGSVTIGVAGAGLTDSVSLTVRVPAGSVAIAPAFDTVSVGASRTFTAVVSDSFGAPIAVPVAWSAPTPAVASVAATGVATGVASGLGFIAAFADAATDTSMIAVLQSGDLLSTAFPNSLLEAAVGADSTFTVPVKLDMSRVGATGDLGAIEMELAYDSAVVRFDSATVDAQGLGVFNDQGDRVAFSLVDTNAQGTTDVTLMTVHFTVKSVAIGTTATFGVSYPRLPVRIDLSTYPMPLLVGGRIRVAY